jgi:L-seryl-tRNA(Ser) seleniumtransferase
VGEDWDTSLRSYDAKAQVITDAVKKFGVTALPRQFNPQALGNVTPRYSWQIDPAKLKITGKEVMQKLADARPLAIGSMGAGASGMRGRDPEGKLKEENHDNRRPARDPNSFGFAVWQLKNGEEKLIADRLAEIFSSVPKA